MKTGNIEGCAEFADSAQQLAVRAAKQFGLSFRRALEQLVLRLASDVRLWDLAVPEVVPDMLHGAERRR